MFRKGLRRAAVILFWLGVWLALALAVDNPVLLATPGTVLRALFELLGEALFWEAVAGSLLRIGAGFLLGFLTAFCLAAISFRFPAVKELLRPPVGLMKTVPVAAFAVLVLIWWGSSLLSVAVCFLAVFPNIYVSVLEGLRNADRKLLEMAKVFGVSRGRRFCYIYRPALRPFLESSLKLALGMSWKAGVAAEVIGTPAHSVGGQLYLAKVYLDTPGVLAWTAVTIVLSLCMEKAVLWLVGRFFDRKPGPSTGRCAAVSSVPGRLALCDISKSFGEKKVLEHLSAVYEPGRTYCLTWPSGSGKTTLLRILCGLEQPDSGRVEGTGRFGVVFQEDRLCEDYDAVQNVALVTGDSERAREALLQLLEDGDLEKPCGSLSGGMRRRVSLVRAMESESDVLLLDEPFTGMDAAARERAEEYIRRRQGGRTLILAFHPR